MATEGVAAGCRVATEPENADKGGRVASAMRRCWAWQNLPENENGPFFFSALCDAVVFISAMQAAAEPLWALEITDDGGGPFRRALPPTLKPRQDVDRPDPFLLTPLEQGLLWTVVALGIVKWILIVLRCLRFRARTGNYAEFFCIAGQLAMSSAALAEFNKRTIDLDISFTNTTFYLALCITISFAVPSMLLRAVDLALGSPETISYAKRELIISTFILLVVLISWAFAFDAVEKWDFHRGLIFGVVFFTTIGYGNDTPRTEAGKILVITYGCVGLVVMLNYLLSIRNVLVESIELHLRPLVESRVRKISAQRQDRNRAKTALGRMPSGTIFYDDPEKGIKRVQAAARSDAVPKISAPGADPPPPTELAAKEVAARNGHVPTTASVWEQPAPNDVDDMEPLPLPLSPDVPDSANMEPDHDSPDPVSSSTDDITSFWSQRVATSPYGDNSEQARAPGLERAHEFGAAKDVQQTGEEVPSIREAWGADVGQIPAEGDPKVGTLVRPQRSADPAPAGDMEAPPAAGETVGAADASPADSGPGAVPKSPPGIAFKEPANARQRTSLDPMTAYFAEAAASGNAQNGTAQNAASADDGRAVGSATPAQVARQRRLSRARRLDPGKERLNRRATWIAMAGDLFKEEEAIQLWTDRLIAIGMGALTVIWWLGGAGIFCALQPRWTYLDAVYFVFISITTTGFGDLFPTTAAAWQFWLYFNILTISLWAFAITVVGNLLMNQNATVIERLTKTLERYDTGNEDRHESGMPAAEFKEKWWE
ncbi:hypothetical protein DFJ74DRAFT_756675 [Hyaloraphidium curvatum]|nr:hypothetical protein DFJ74DRAFT_756675 [Hyaloraphidium curvatum]